MMKKHFSYVSLRAQYQNDSGDLFCSDQRFDPGFQAYRKQFHMPDPIILPGGTKALVDPGYAGVTEYVVNCIVVLRGAHGFKKFRLWGHNECAACGGVTDPAFYEAMLRKGGAILSAAIPNLEVELHFADFDGFYQIV
ncbi:MAG: hypothetical protein ACYDA9_05015 [Terriglobia bacterium]